VNRLLGAGRLCIGFHSHGQIDVSWYELAAGFLVPSLRGIDGVSFSKYCGSATILIAAWMLNGCATPPADSHYAETAYQVQLAAASYEEQAKVTLPAEAELAGAHPVDFYIQLALERNPEILAAQRHVSAQAEVIPQVTALDDPMLSDTFQPIDNHSLQTASGRGPNMLSVSQRFPWFGKLRIRGEVAEQETKIALTRLAQSQLKVVEDVYFAYYEIYFNQRAIELTLESKKQLSRYVEYMKPRVRTNLISQRDLYRAQVEVLQAESKLVRLRQHLRLAQADLAKIVHTSPNAELSAVKLDMASSPEEIEQLYEAAVRCRPELQEQLHAIVRDERKRELAALNFRPDITAGLGWQAITSSDAVSPVANGRDNVSMMIGVNLPIWRDKLQAGVRQSEHRVVESARRYDATRDDTFRMIRRLTVEIHSLEEQIRLFRNPKDGIIPKAKQTLDLSFFDYQVQKVDVQQVIDNWANWLNFQIQASRFEANRGQRLASLERVIGCQLATLSDPPLTHSRPPAPSEITPQPKAWRSRP